jgi:hypothetical protein
MSKTIKKCQVFVFVRSGHWCLKLWMATSTASESMHYAVVATVEELQSLIRSDCTIAVCLLDSALFWQVSSGDAHCDVSTGLHSTENHLFYTSHTLSCKQSKDHTNDFA